MKRALVLAASMLALALAPAFAADAPAAARPAAAPAKAGAKFNLARMHDAHVKKGGMECGDCHTDTQADLLVMKNYAASGTPPVDRGACVACHRPPHKPAWYGAVPK